MSALPQIWLVRHGQTEWSLGGRHTGRTDVPLTPAGEADPLRLRASLAAMTFDTVLTSPLRRARRTCELAGYGARAQPERALLEWDYGRYEGMTLAQIRAQRPGWNLFHDGCPGGESLPDVVARCDALIERLRASGATVLAFSSGHLLRVLAIRWIGLAGDAAHALYLDTGSLSVLGYHHDRDDPVIRLWNQVPRADVSN